MSWNKFCSVDDDYSFYDTDMYAKYRQYLSEWYDELNKNKIDAKPKPSHIFCKNCNSNEIWIDVRQIRSGDEGATTFFKCSKCKDKWTMN